MQLKQKIALLKMLAETLDDHGDRADTMIMGRFSQESHAKGYAQGQVELAIRLLELLGESCD